MLNDHQRNRQYHLAIARALARARLRAAPIRMLDCGCGAGLLSLLAAREAGATGGALEITAVELSPLIADLAQPILRDGADAGTQLMTCDVRGLRAEEVGRYDIIVSELMDASGVGESLLSVLQHACHHLARPGAQVGKGWAGWPGRCTIRGPYTGWAKVHPWYSQRLEPNVFHGTGVVVHVAWPQSLAVVAWMQQQGICLDPICFNALAAACRPAWRRAVLGQALTQSPGLSAVMDGCGSDGSWRQAEDLLGSVNRRWLQLDQVIGNAALGACRAWQRGVGLFEQLKWRSFWESGTGRHDSAPDLTEPSNSELRTGGGLVAKQSAATGGDRVVRAASG
eukprot:Skav215690  [mRNA]  locus=scaffold278:322367:332463:- [translate_table: standard]